MSKPDTNQVSEDELMRQLGFRYEPSEGGYYIHKFVKSQETPSSLNSVLVPEVAKQIQALIRAEKLKLLAEVRERVIGEDVELNSFEIPMYEEEFVITSVTQQNHLRADQRISLAKLEANQ